MRCITGLLHRRAGQNKAAAELLTDVPEPKLVPAYAIDLLRGQVLSDLKQYDAAIASLNKIKLDDLQPNIVASVHYLKGLAYRASRTCAAADALTAAAQLDTPMRPRALLDLARVQASQSQTAEAVKTLESCLKTNDNNIAAEAARLAGDLSYELGNYDQALTFYQRVVDRHQSSQHFGPAVAGILWSHYSLGQYQQVLQSYEKYTSVLPVQERVVAWYLAGSAHQELGDHEKAVQLFTQITQTETRLPIQEKALYKLAKSQFELRQYDAMRQTIKTLSARYPKSQRLVDATYMLAAADAEQGDVQHGGSAFNGVDPGRRAASVLPSRAAPPGAAVSAARRGGAGGQRLRPVRGRFPRAGDFSETVQQAALQHIDLLYQLGQYDQAEKAVKALLEQKQLDAVVQQEALYRGALVKLRQGQAEASLNILQTLNDKYPGHAHRAEEIYYRGLLQMSLGHAEKALPILERTANDDKLSTRLRQCTAPARDSSSQGRHRRWQARAPDTATAGATRRPGKPRRGRPPLAGARCARPPAGERGYRLSSAAAQAAPDAKVAQRAQAMFLVGKAYRQLNQLDDAIKAFDGAASAGGPVLGLRRNWKRRTPSATTANWKQRCKLMPCRSALTAVAMTCWWQRDCSAQR